MNGNQGLDALAALCGGAFQARTVEERDQSNNYPTATNHDTTAAVTSPPATLQNPQVLPVVAPCQATGTNLPPPSAGQQWLQYVASSYAGAPSAVAPDAGFPGMLAASYSLGGPSNSSATAFQQWMCSLQGQYQALFQAQATQLAQQYAHQQQRHRFAASPGAFMDPASVAMAAKVFAAAGGETRFFLMILYTAFWTYVSSSRLTQ